MLVGMCMHEKMVQEGEERKKPLFSEMGFFLPHSNALLCKYGRRLAGYLAFIKRGQNSK